MDLDEEMRSTETEYSSNSLVHNFLHKGKGIKIPSTVGRQSEILVEL